MGTLFCQVTKPSLLISATSAKKQFRCVSKKKFRKVRKVAKDDFEKDFYKRMSNSVFGKTMENARNRADIEILNGNDKGDEKRLLRRISKPNFGGAFIFEN